jgi:hypothetical protein
VSVIAELFSVEHNLWYRRHYIESVGVAPFNLCGRHGFDPDIDKAHVVVELGNALSSLASVAGVARGDQVIYVVYIFACLKLGALVLDVHVLVFFPAL